VRSARLFSEMKSFPSCVCWVMVREEMTLPICEPPVYLHCHLTLPWVSQPSPFVHRC
jgi:hypothetical protein